MKINIIKVFAGVLILFTVFSITLGRSGGVFTTMTTDYEEMIDSFVSTNNNTFELTIGDEHSLNNAWLNSKGVTVYSSDENIVTISKYGKVTAVGEGTAYIVIVTRHENFEVYRFDVYSPVPEADLSNLPEIDGIDFASEIANFTSTSLNTNTLKIGDTHKPLTWSSAKHYVSDTSVINVDSNGEVTAVGKGTAYLITAVDESIYNVYKYVVNG